MDDWFHEIQYLLTCIRTPLTHGEQVEQGGYPVVEELTVPSLTKAVEAELTQSEPRTVEQLREQRTAQVRHLESVRWTAHIDCSRKLKSSVSQRTSASNALKPYSTAGGSNMIVNECRAELEVDLYGNRWGSFTSSVYGLENTLEQISKISTIRIPCACTLGELYDAFLPALASRTSFEAASYAAGGMLVFLHPEGPVRVFANRRQDAENFCDYSQYVQPGQTEVWDMDAARIAEHWTALCSSEGFLVHTGNQVERIYINNVFLTATPSDAATSVKEIYRRSIRKVTWCALCGGRVAQLVVVDDEKLSMTPAFICKDCYRSFRSDVEGNFLEPGAHVAVYLFNEF